MWDCETDLCPQGMADGSVIVRQGTFVQSLWGMTGSRQAKKPCSNFGLGCEVVGEVVTIIARSGRSCNWQFIKFWVVVKVKVM